jgi:pyruvate formate lyase activating enzyme
MAIDYLGLVPTSLLDYPGEVAAVVFTPGCNFRCPYCHNPEVVLGKASGEEIPVSRFFDFLKKRKAVLGGVSITGGEPFIHDDLEDLVREIRGFNLKVKIDTNGSFPEKLKQSSADYFAMDLKTLPENYGRLLAPGAGPPEDLPGRIRESLAWLKKSRRSYHLRTTAVPGFLDREDFIKMLALLKGEEVYYLSGFRPQKTLDPAYGLVKPYPEEELLQWKALAEAAGIRCVLRVNRTHGE